MIPLGLSVPDQAKFEAGLVAPHSIRIGIEVLDLDQRLVSVVQGMVLSGQVDFDTTADVDRTASVEILDPDNQLNLDTGSAATGGMFLDRMLRITYGVWSHEFPQWVDVPIFTGPIDTLARNNDILSITAQGKDALTRIPASYNHTYPKGSYKTDILKGVLGMMGEEYLDLPHWPDKTTTPLSIASLTEVWSFIQSIARSWGDGRIFYDGRGYARLVKSNPRTLWTFKRGPGGSLGSEPKLSYDLSGVRNMIVVTGATPAGAKQPIQAIAHAAATHPLSSTSLGRGGRKRYLREDIQDDTITTVKAAQERANTQLQQALMAGVQMSFDSLVIPHLEPLDVVAVDGGTWSFPMLLTKWTIPLVGDGKMVVNRDYFVRTVSRPRNVARKGPRRGR